jgi:hypothetical protein
MGRKKISEDQKATKPGVALNAECRAILQRVLKYEFGKNLTEMNHSQAVRKCVRVAWEKHYEKLCLEYEKTGNLISRGEEGEHSRASTKSMGNVAAQTHTGRKVVTPHSRSVGGSSTAPQGRSRKTG